VIHSFFLSLCKSFSLSFTVTASGSLSHVRSLILSCCCNLKFPPVSLFPLSDSVCVSRSLFVCLCLCLSLFLFLSVFLFLILSRVLVLTHTHTHTTLAIFLSCSLSGYVHAFCYPTALCAAFWRQEEGG